MGAEHTLSDLLSAPSSAGNMTSSAVSPQVFIVFVRVRVVSCGRASGSVCGEFVDGRFGVTQYMGVYVCVRGLCEWRVRGCASSAHAKEQRGGESG